MSNPELTNQSPTEPTFDDLLKLPDAIPRTGYPAHTNHPLHRKQDIPPVVQAPYVGGESTFGNRPTDYEIAAMRQKEWYEGVVVPRLGATILPTEVSAPERV